MRKITLLFLILGLTAICTSKVVRIKKLNAKRQIFDTLDYNKQYNTRLSPNQIILRGYDKPATYLPPTKFVPSTYLPPVTTRSTTTPRPTTRPTTTRPTTTRPTTPKPTTRPTFVPSTYLPPSPTTSKPKSTPGATYIPPVIITTTRRPTTLPPLQTFPPYTGTFPTYTYSTYNYTFTGTYPTPPVTFRPLVSTTTTTRKPFGYVYNAPSQQFLREE